MRRIILARSAAEISGLEERWDAVHALSGATFFQSYAWNALAARVFAGTQAPCVIYAETDSGTCLIPGAISPERRFTLLGEELFDYRDVLHTGDAGALTLAWRELARRELPLWVPAVRESEAASWTPFKMQLFCNAPQLRRRELRPPASLTPGPTLTRSLRRLTREGVVFRRYDGSASTLVRLACEQKAAQFSGSGNNLFADVRRREFLVAAAALDPGACDIFCCLEAGARPVAILVTFRDRDTRRFYLTYFDRVWAKHSPGMALLFQATCLSLEEGLDCDYMTGEHPYKLRLATSMVRLFRVSATAEQVARMGMSAPVEAA